MNGMIPQDYAYSSTAGYIPLGRQMQEKSVRRHDVDSKSLLAESDARSKSQISRSQRTHTTHRTTSTAQNGHGAHARNKSYVPPVTTDHVVPVDSFKKPPTPKKSSAEEKFTAGRREQDFKYRADDQIFPHNVEFSPGKDPVIANTSTPPPEHYYAPSEHPLYTPNLAHNPYFRHRQRDSKGLLRHNKEEIDQHNRILAEQAKLSKSMTKHQDLREDQEYLNN